MYGDREYQYQFVTTKENGEKEIEEMGSSIIEQVKSNILAFYRKSKLDNLKREVITDNEEIKEAEKIVIADMQPVTRETFMKDTRKMYQHFTKTELTEEDEKIIEEEFDDFITEELESINSEDLPQWIEINGSVFHLVDMFIDYKEEMQREKINRTLLKKQRWKWWIYL